METVPLWRQYLAGATSDSPNALSDNPDLAAYYNAQARAAGLGLENTEGLREPGLFLRAVSAIQTPRAGIYAGLRGVYDAASGRGFDASDFASRFERARTEGEGFGSTGPLVAGPDAGRVERVSKLIASGVLDIGLDPLTYVTLGTGTVGKAALGGIARASGTRGSREAALAAAEQGSKEVGDLLRVQAATEATEKLARRKLEFGTRTQRENIDSVLESSNIFDLASERIADVISTARVAGTARTVRQTLAKELKEVGLENADEVALRVTRSLDPEFRGGVRLSAPFSRAGIDLTPGGGTVLDQVGLGGAADAANRARLAARARLRREGGILGQIGGESNEAYGTLVRTLSQVSDPFELLTTPGAITATEVAKLQAAQTVKRQARSAFLRAADNRVSQAASSISRLIAQGRSEADVREVLRAAYHRDGLDETLSRLGLSAEDDLVKDLISGAQNIRDVSTDVATLRGLDPDPGYVPNIVSTEGLEYLRRTYPRAWGRVGASDPTMGRVAFEDIVAELDPSEDIVRITRSRKSIPEINRMMRERDHDFDFFLEDPMEIVAAQVRREGTRLETEAFVNALQREGLIVRSPVTATQSPLIARQRLVGTLDTLRTEAENLVSANRSALPDADAQLQETKMAFDRAVAAGNASRAEAKTRLDASRVSLDAARKDVSAANREIRSAERRLARAASEGDIKQRDKLRRQVAKLKSQRDEKLRLRDELDMTVNEDARLMAEADAAIKSARIERIAAQSDAIDKWITGTGDARVTALRNTLVGASDNQIAAMEQAIEAATNLATRKTMANNAARLRDDLTKIYQRKTGLERETSEQVRQAFSAIENLESRIEAAVGVNRTLAERTKQINTVLEETGNWEEVSLLFGELVRDFKNAGASLNTTRTAAGGVRSARAGQRAAQQRDAQSELIRTLGLRSPQDLPGVTKYPQSFEQWLTADWLSDTMNSMYRIGGSAQNVRTLLSPYVDPYMRLFKTWATLGRGPGYHVRNWVGGMVNNWLIGVRGSAVPVAFRMTSAIAKAQKEINEKVLRNEIPAGTAEQAFRDAVRQELRAQFKDASGRPTTVGGDWGDLLPEKVVEDFFAEGIQYARTNELIERNASRAAAASRGDSGADRFANFVESPLAEGLGWIGFNARVAETSEIGMRMSAFLEGYARFDGDRQAAGLFAKAAHFDYQDLTDAEKALKFVVPFYTWTRYNLPFQMRQAVNNPGSINRLEIIANNLRTAFEDPNGEGILPEWMERRRGFESTLSYRGNKIGFMVESPQIDLYNLFANDSRWQPVRMEELFESSNPLFKTAYEAFTGRDTRSGAEVDYTRSVRNLVPPLGLGMRLAGATEPDRDRIVTSWLSTALGIPAGTLTEGSVRNEARQRVQRISEDVNAAVAPFLQEGEELDTRWLTQMSQEGKQPAEIVSLLSQGYGRVGGPKLPERRGQGTALSVLKNYMGG